MYIAVKSVLNISLFILSEDNFIQIRRAANGSKMSDTVALAVIPAALQPFAVKKQNYVN